jgi:hypothetical protein
MEEYSEVFYYKCIDVKIQKEYAKPLVSRILKRVAGCRKVIRRLKTGIEKGGIIP